MIALEAKPGLLAPGSFHICLKNNDKIMLYQEPPVWGVRPAIDVTLVSATKFYKEDLIFVILTGMGRDGTRGAELVKKSKGFCIAEV